MDKVEGEYKAAGRVVAARYALSVFPSMIYVLIIIVTSMLACEGPIGAGALRARECTAWLLFSSCLSSKHEQEETKKRRRKREKEKERRREREGKRAGKRRTPKHSSLEPHFPKRGIVART